MPNHTKNAKTYQKYHTKPKYAKPYQNMPNHIKNTKSCQKYPNMPNHSKIYQTIPKYAKPYQKCKTIPKIPNHSQICQIIPKMSKHTKNTKPYQNMPNHIKMCQTIPKHAKPYLHMPNYSNLWVTINFCQNNPLHAQLLTTPYMPNQTTTFQTIPNLKKCQTIPLHRSQIHSLWSAIFKNIYHVGVSSKNRCSLQWRSLLEVIDIICSGHHCIVYALGFPKRYNM